MFFGALCLGVMLDPNFRYEILTGTDITYFDVNWVSVIGQGVTTAKCQVSFTAPKQGSYT